jgi:hypothetical protein
MSDTWWFVEHRIRRGINRWGPWTPDPREAYCFRGAARRVARDLRERESRMDRPGISGSIWQYRVMPWVRRAATAIAKVEL